MARKLNHDSCLCPFVSFHKGLSLTLVAGPSDTHWLTSSHDPAVGGSGENANNNITMYIKETSWRLKVLVSGRQPFEIIV